LLLLLPLLAAAVSIAAAPSAPDSPFVNAPSVDAERALRRMASADPSSLTSDAEKQKWAKARLAWIALARLQGRDDEALKIFGGCAGWCEKNGPKEEWAGAKAWACARDPKAGPCGPKRAKK